MGSYVSRILVSDNFLILHENVGFKNSPNLHYEERKHNLPHAQKRGARQDARSHPKITAHLQHKAA